MSSHGGSVEWEAEEAAVDALAAQMAEQSYPGVFAGGKQIVRTHAEDQAGRQVMIFVFDDGSAMAVVGVFQIKYAQNAKNISEDLPNVEATIEGKVGDTTHVLGEGD